MEEEEGIKPGCFGKFSWLNPKCLHCRVWLACEGIEAKEGELVRKGMSPEQARREAEKLTIPLHKKALPKDENVKNKELMTRRKQVGMVLVIWGVVLWIIGMFWFPISMDAKLYQGSPSQYASGGGVWHQIGIGIIGSILFFLGCILLILHHFYMNAFRATCSRCGINGFEGENLHRCEICKSFLCKPCWNMHIKGKHPKTSIGQTEEY